MARKQGQTANQAFKEATRIQRLASLKGARFEDDTPERQLRRKAEALVLPERFNRTYLGHYFRDAGSPYQVVLYLALEHAKRIASRVPRGCGKTTVVGFAYVVHQVVCAQALRELRDGTLEAKDPALYAAVRDVMREEASRRIAAGPLTVKGLGLPEHWDPAVETKMDAWLEGVYAEQLRLGHTIRTHWDPYIQFVSVKEEEAGDVLGSVRAELERNELIRSDWGDLTPCMVGDWTRKQRRAASQMDFESNGTRVRGYGMAEAIRGGKHGQWRPTLALFDDPDSEETVRTGGQRDGNLKKVTRAVSYGLEPEVGRVMINGTPHHPDAIICRVTEQEQFKDRWVVVRFRVVDEKGVLLYPTRWSAEAIAEERTEDPEGYESELGDRPPAIGGRPVRELHYYEFDDFVPLKLTKVMAFDPSLGKNKKSDFQALVTLRGPTSQGWFLVHRVELLRIADPLMLAERLDEIYQEEVPDIAVMEAISLGHWIEMLTTAQGKASRSFATWLRIERQEDGKDVRIYGCAPALNNGTIRFPSDHRFRLLERQWLDYGDSGSKKDGPDVTEMAFRFARPIKTLGAAGIRHTPRESRRIDGAARRDRGFGREPESNSRMFR